MKASQGDRITIRGKTVGSSERHGQIVEVHGADGAPPYVVRFDDGHETTVIPGGDFVIDRIHPATEPAGVAFPGREVHPVSKRGPARNRAGAVNAGSRQGTRIGGS